MPKAHALGRTVQQHLITGSSLTYYKARLLNLIQLQTKLSNNNSLDVLPVSPLTETDYYTLFVFQGFC